MRYVELSHPVHEYPFNNYNNLIPVQNGIVKLDFESNKAALINYSPEYCFNYKLPVIFNPNRRNTVLYDKMFSQYTSDETGVILYQAPAQGIAQMLGYGTFKKSYIFQGDGDAGSHVSRIAKKETGALSSPRVASNGGSLNVRPAQKISPSQEPGRFRAAARLHS